MRRIFLGGSFEPVHTGHLWVARDVLEELKPDKIIFVPAFQAPLKEPHQATPQERFEMLSIATEGVKGFEVSHMEIKRGGISYTVDTAQELFINFGERPTFLVGADSILSLHMWKQPQKLIRLAVFIIADRNKRAEDVRNYLRANFPELKEGRDFYILKTRNIDVSSTEVRNRVKVGKSIKWLVPESVESYILEKGLYTKEQLRA